MYKRAKSSVVLGLLAVLILTLAVPGAAFAQGPDGKLTATPLSPSSTITVTKSEVAGGAPMVPVIVKLKGDSLAAYQGGVPGLAPTNPAVTGERQLNVSSSRSKAYLAYLDQKQNEFVAAAMAAIPSAKVTNRLDVVLNAVAMTVPADRIDALAALPGVAAVYPDELRHPQTDNSPQFIGAPAVWSQLGGQESSGEGVIVGVLDTGIWPEHPSFSDPDPSGKPYAAPPAAPSGQPRACQFSGGDNPGEEFTCNNKLIGAQRFMDTYDANVELAPGEYTSARDDDGHGTHTSSTAAGNAGVAASIYGVSRGIVSGVAPRAHVIMYRVCGADGCYGSDSAAAVQQAIKDGVNAINFSISGGSTPYTDAVEMAFLDAYSAGVFVAASAGNSGPGADTTDHRGPWVTTVAASTQDRQFANTATLTAEGGATLTVEGASITAGVGPAPVFVPTGSDENLRCDKPLEAGSVAGKIVVCKRGTTGRAEKGYNVLQGGALGMILYNQADNVTDLETDNHWLPATHIQFAEGTKVLDFINKNTNVQATLTEGQKAAAQGDVMASFSSRGGPGQSLGVSKPDITAPGVQILAGHSQEHLPPPDGIALGPEGELFQAIAGTSMSSPHIAGSGALLKALHPDWTPGQIKSAIMMTAKTAVVKEDEKTPANAFDYGSGRVDLNKAGDPGLTIAASSLDFIAHQADLWNANYPSVYVPALTGVLTVQRTVHNQKSAAGQWTLSVAGATDFSVTVPNSLSVPANGDATFSITIDARDVPVGQVRMATLYLTSGARMLHVPITFVRREAPVTISKTCDPAQIALGGTTECTITVTNTGFNGANVAVTDKLPRELELVPGGVTGGVASADQRTVSFNGSLVGAQPPDISIGPGVTPAGYLPLSTFGVAPISGVGDETAINFNVPAFSYGGETYSRLAIVSDGYAIVGGATGSADIQFVNQKLPDPARPNNVIAPFWTDLNPPAGGALRASTLTDGADTWIVLEWEAVMEWGTGKANSFQIWIGVNGDAHPEEDVSIAYGPIEGNGADGLLTVGAENRSGNRGGNYYYNGTGTLPEEDTELVVASAAPEPGGTQEITYTAEGVRTGKWVNYAEMAGNLWQGVSAARFAGQVGEITDTYLPVIMK